MSVVVVGSANRDYIIGTEDDPVQGGLVVTDDLKRRSGGLGVNQSIVAARMGAHVSFVGCVGDDPDGADIIEQLTAEGVDTTCTEVVAGATTGIAFVFSHSEGTHSIVVAPGANVSLTRRTVELGIARATGENRVLLTQGETPAELIEHAVALAVESRIRVVINLAPHQPLPARTLAASDPLVANEIEASALTGTTITSVEQAMAAARKLLSRCRSIVITLGGDGVVWAADGSVQHVPAAPAGAVVDVSGAGDTFSGTLAAHLADGLTLDIAIKRAVDAAGIVVTRPGVIPAFPSRRELAAATR